jgi:hypothetical protein
MKVSDLIEILRELDPTAEIILSSDPEGNKFAPVEDFATGFFDSREQTFYNEDEFFEEDPDYLDDEGSSTHGDIAVVLWPSY